MRNITKFVEDLVHERNTIIARLGSLQGVDLTLGDYSNFIPNTSFQKRCLEDITDLAMELWTTYKDMNLPERLQYCKEVGKFKEEYSGIWKDDALKLLGLEANSDINLLFDGRVHLFEDNNTTPNEITTGNVGEVDIDRTSIA